MSFDWQSSIVLAIVAAAGCYLALVAWRTVVKRKAAACGSCADCPQGASAKQIVTLETLAHRTSDGPLYRPPTGGAI